MAYQNFIHYHKNENITEAHKEVKDDQYRWGRREFEFSCDSNHYVNILQM